MSDTPPIEEPPVGADAIDAGQARDTVENAAHGVYVAALLWYALHGDDKPGEESLIRKSARRLARALWWARPRLSSTKPPGSTVADQEKWIDRRTDQIVEGSLDDAGAHYDTVFKRIRRDDPRAAPHASATAARSALRLDDAWAAAAARTAATKLAAETAIDMQPDVESFTGEPHHLMWISRGDPKVRKLHRSLHGRVRPPGTPFHTWPDGATLNYPGDQTAPIDSWINCRCALMLVPAKDAEHAEEVFAVPDADFDVPVAASAGWSVEARRAEQDLRSEKARRYTTRV